MIHIHLNPPSPPSKSPHASPRMRQIAAAFGLDLPSSLHSAPPPRPILTPAAALLQPGDILLITGPSGTGKSTLLTHLHRQLSPHHSIATLSHIPLQNTRALLDSFHLPLHQTLAALSRAGLAEAKLWLRTPAQLSEGQQFRYRLARLSVSPASILLADEFCATLDRQTAQILAWQFQRHIRTTKKIALLATSHQDLTQDLNPTLHIQLIE